MQTVHYLGSKRADSPVLHRTKAYGAFEVIFPRTKLPPVRLGQPEGGLLCDRLMLAPGVELRLAEQEKNTESLPSTVSLNGRVFALELERFLTDPTLWSAAQLNDAKYQLGRGYYNKRAYRIFGMAQAQGKTYLAVSWYSPAASDRHDAQGLIFRLDGDAKAPIPVPVYTIPDVGNDPNTDMPRPLLLDTLPSGDLLLSAGGKLSQRNEKEEWSAFPSRLQGRYPQLLTYGALWKRGHWRVTGHQWEAGKAIQFQVLVADEATRKKACEFSWSVRL